MIFSPGDVAQAAGNLVALAENVGLRRELSSRGRREILSCYSIESMTAGWAACLSKALEQASRCDQGRPLGRSSRGVSSAYSDGAPQRGPSSDRAPLPSPGRQRVAPLRSLGSR